MKIVKEEMSAFSYHTHFDQRICYLLFDNVFYVFRPISQEIQCPIENGHLLVETQM